MSDIRLDDGTINVDGEWLTVDDLTRRIQEKMETGDLKLTELAAALEELNQTIQNSHTLEVSLVITGDQYGQLKALGGEDDRECVRQAIMAFIDQTGQSEIQVKDTTDSEPQTKDDTPQGQSGYLTIDCPHPQCMTPIEITSYERPIMVECPNCGLNGWIMENNQWGKPDKKES